MNEQQRAAHDAVVKALMDQGKIIEAGFALMRMQAISPTAPQIQVDEMRFAYMAGAQHVFASMMSGLDPDHDPTPADMRRMALIANELDAFSHVLRQRVGMPAEPTGGGH